MADMLDAMAYATTRIQSSKLWAKHPTRKYKVIFQAHPLVIRLCWMLRSRVRIKPWIEGWYPDDADPIYMKQNNTLFMGERHYKLFKEQPNG